MYRLALSSLGTLLVCLLPLSVSAKLFLNPPESSLTLPKSDGVVGIHFDYKRSSDFFDSGGTRRNSSDPSFPDGLPETYHDFRTIISAGYGLTNGLTVFLSLPILYRKETRAFNAEDLGLGDATAGARLRFYQNKLWDFELAAELSARFPSGDTDIEFPDAATGRNLELPLGTGNTDVIPKFLAKKRFLGGKLSVEGAVAYAIRFDAVVEYLQTPLVLQTAPDGSVFALPLGNLEVDWGDEITAEMQFGWRPLEWLSFVNQVIYMHRLQTKVRSFTFTSVGGAILIDALPLTGSASDYLTVLPSLIFDLPHDLRLSAGVEIPVYGSSYPTIPLVESLIGNRYQFEVRYGF